MADFTLSYTGEKIDEILGKAEEIGEVAIEDIVPLKKGGTEASDRATGLYNLLFLGSNPVVASDTREAWNKYGNFIAYFDSNATVINKPPNVAANGMMQQISTGNVLHQIWYEYSKNNIYTRSANTAGWSGSASVSGADAWSKVFNPNNSVITVASTGTDLNDYKEFGWYYFDGNHTPTNVPAGVNGWLQVITTSGTAVKQIWYRMGTINSNDYQTFVRTFNGTNWGDWKQIRMEFDVLPISKGGTGATTTPDIVKMLCSNGTGNSAPAYVMGFNSGYADSGYTSIKNLRNTMGLGNTTGALPVANGGTGATTPTGIKSSIGVGSLLWNGTWTSGTCTIPNTNDYYIFMVDFVDHATPVLAVRQGDYIRGIGGYSTGSTIETYQFTATRSGDLWTLLYADRLTHTPSSNHTARLSLSIQFIRGII